jgi:hypothetical protein
MIDVLGGQSGVAAESATIVRCEVGICVGIAPNHQLSGK